MYALSKRIGEEIIAAAARRGQLTAISVRLSWIQTPESFGRDIAPRRSDPAFGAQNLWGYIDGRDAGAGLCTALEADVQGHRVLYLSAADSFMEGDTAP